MRTHLVPVQPSVFGGEQIVAKASKDWAGGEAAAELAAQHEVCAESDLVSGRNATVRGQLRLESIDLRHERCELVTAEGVLDYAEPQLIELGCLRLCDHAQLCAPRGAVFAPAEWRVHERRLVVLCKAQVVCRRGIGASPRPGRCSERRIDARAVVVLGRSITGCRCCCVRGHEVDTLAPTRAVHVHVRSATAVAGPVLRPSGRLLVTEVPPTRRQPSIHAVHSLAHLKRLTFSLLRLVRLFPSSFT